MKHHNYYTYITTNPSKTTFYTGVTNNLEQRLTEHFFNRGKPETFAGKYYCYSLVYFERYLYIEEAIAREKEIKNMLRIKKLQLIKTINPKFDFLNKSIVEDWPPKYIEKRVG